MPRRQIILATLFLAVIAIGGAIAWRIWREQQRAALIVARLPAPPPDLNRWPAEFPRKLREATDEARSAKNPATALGALARLYFANGFDAEAKQVLATLRELEPANARWPYLLAEIHRRTGNTADTEQALQATVQLAPDYVPAQLRLGDSLAQRGALDAARESYQRAFALAPTDVNTAYARIAFEARLGRRGDPLGDLAKLVHEHPGIAQLHQLLGELLVAAGDQPGAERQRHLAATAERELETTDPWIDELMPLCFDATRVSLRAVAAFRERRLADAEKLLQQAIALAPADALLRDSLAHVYELMKRPADARATLEKAVRDCPDDPLLPARLARLLSQQHESTAAIALLRAALQRWPSDSGLHGALGFTLRDANQNADALPELREAVRLDPTFVEAHYQLGFCLLAAGQHEAARAAVEKALAMRPDYFDALIFLGGLALETRDLVAAERHVSRLYALRPDDASARLIFATLQWMKGTSTRQTGRSSDAEKFFRAGLAANPEFAPLLLEIGALAAQRGQLAEAKDAFEHHIRLEPHDPRAYVALGKVLSALGQSAEARQVLERGLEVAQKVGAQAQIEECRRLLKNPP